MVDKGSKFHNRSMKSWLEKNDAEIQSTHNEGKSVIAEKLRPYQNLQKHDFSFKKCVY